MLLFTADNFILHANLKNKSIKLTVTAIWSMSNYLSLTVFPFKLQGGRGLGHKPQVLGGINL